MVNKMDRAKKAGELFTEGCNCSQAVVAAYADMVGLSEEDALRASEAFGGGLGRLRRTCGAVSGMCMLAGLKYSKAEKGDIQTRTLIYETVQRLVARFEELNGTSICAELLEGTAVTKGSEPTPRTKEFYQRRPCKNVVEECAKIVYEELFQSTPQK